MMTFNTRISTQNPLCCVVLKDRRSGHVAGHHLSFPFRPIKLKRVQKSRTRRSSWHHRLDENSPSNAIRERLQNATVDDIYAGTAVAKRRARERHEELIAEPAADLDFRESSRSRTLSILLRSNSHPIMKQLTTARMKPDARNGQKIPEFLYDSCCLRVG